MMKTPLPSLCVFVYLAAPAVLGAQEPAAVRKTVLPGLFAFACLPLASMYMYWGPDPARIVSMSALAGLVLLTHRKNLSDEFSHFLERRNAESKPNRK